VGNRRRRFASANPFEHVDVERVDAHLYGALDEELAEADRRRVLVVPLALERLTVDERIQVRVGGLDEEAVETYTNVLLEGGQFEDPIVVFREDEEGPYWLADGFHRYAAHRRAHEHALQDPERDAGQYLMARCEVRYGGYDEAFAYSEEANLTHGLRLSNEDKYNIFRRRVERGHAWLQTSDNAIAQELGVTRMTIGRWRRKLADDVTNVTLTERHTADGRVIDTSNMGREDILTPEQKTLRSAVQHLRRAAAALAELGYDVEDLRNYASDLAKDWNIE